MPNPYLPPEILDRVIDLLHDEPEILKRCCLVSKSWIPRTRKHLFASIMFPFEERLKSWKKTFPDPSISPAHHAKTLFVSCPQVVVAADAEAGGWITGFSRIVRLAVLTNRPFSFVPFRGISPDLKSLRILAPVLPTSQLIGLVLSFPLLEDLDVHVTTSDGMSTDNDGGPDRPLTAVQPSSSPAFSGCLELYMKGGMQPVTHQLLSPPIGIHFRRLALAWYHEGDLLTTITLVERCSHTLESLIITDLSFKPMLFSIDLSEATKLKDVVFKPISRSVKWITKTLKTTLKLQDLREISIYLPYYVTATDAGADVRQGFEEEDWEEWLDLDRLLVQLWESNSIRPKVTRPTQMEGARNTRDGVGYQCLLPEITKRGIIDLTP